MHITQTFHIHHINIGLQFLGHQLIISNAGFTTNNTRPNLKTRGILNRTGDVNISEWAVICENYYRRLNEAQSCPLGATVTRCSTIGKFICVKIREK